MSPTLSSPPLLVPAVFHGQSADARREWRKVAARFVKTGSLEAALAGVDWLNVDTTPAPITLVAPPLTQRDAFHVCWFMEKLTEVARAGLVSESVSDPTERALWYTRMRDLILQGRDQFWVALGLLASNGSWFPMGTLYDDPAERRRTGTAMLNTLLEWWPAFRRIESRFFDVGELTARWPKWVVVPRRIAHQLGLTIDEGRVIEASPDTAYDRLRRLASAGEGRER